MSNGGFAERAVTAASAPAAKPDVTTQDPLPKQPSPITRLRTSIDDLAQALKTDSPLVPPFVINLKLALQAATKARPSASQKDQQTIEELSKQASVLIVRVAAPRILSVEPGRPTAKDFVVDWDEVGRVLDDAYPGVGSLITKGPQLHRDVADVLLRSPAYVPEVFREQAVNYLKQWPEFLAITGGLMLAEGLVGVLIAAPEPVVTKLLAALLQGAIIAFALHAAATAAIGASELAQQWWSMVSNANGDSKALDAAARTFVELVFVIVGALLAAIGAAAGIQQAFRGLGGRSPQEPREQRRLPEGTEKPTTEKSTTEKSTTEKSTTEKSTTEKSTTEKSTTEKQTTEKSPTENSPTGESPTKNSTSEKQTTEKSPTEESNAVHSNAEHSNAEKAQSHTGDRVNHRVSGLYESIDINHVPEGWRFKDVKQSGGFIRTDVWDPAGRTGYVIRRYDPMKKQWIMKEAFFDKDLSSWIKTNGTPLTERGIPLVAYLDLRTMKRFNVGLSGMKTTKMSMVQNIEAICQLEALARKGVPHAEGVKQTDSVTYARTELTQSGHEVTSIRIEKGETLPFEPLLRHYEEQGFRTKEDHQDILDRYKIKRGDAVFQSYDIILELAPEHAP